MQMVKFKEGIGDGSCNNIKVRCHFGTMREQDNLDGEKAKIFVTFL